MQDKCVLPNRQYRLNLKGPFGTYRFRLLLDDVDAHALADAIVRDDVQLQLDQLVVEIRRPAAA